MSKKIILFLAILLGLLIGGLALVKGSGKKSATYFNVPKLSSTCPPGFKLNERNECISQNLYKQYATGNDPGVGGLKTALPAVRDGFSPQEIDLGRYLFFDPALSGNGTISCASCHDPNKGFSDGLPTSRGINNEFIDRAAPTLWNVAYLKSFFWDGRATTLEEQMKGPLFDEKEMANTPENLIQTMNSLENYKLLFAEAFPTRNKKDRITLDEIYRSIVAFQSSLISLNSKYDQYAHGYHQAPNQKEIEGRNIFRSFVARCAECHTPPLFTNQQIAVLGVPEPKGSDFDPGAELPFKDETLRGGFKVPSLRNIDKTAPYMHSGVFPTLRETVQFYNNGRGHAVPEEEDLILHWHIWEPNLTDYELDRIVDFLKTLTDESFMPKIPEKLPSGITISQNQQLN
ncbi:MAG: cytochrome c peroxidase [Arenibacter sp.]|nr:cytochrome c peroxidase [Arenibacter sp.]